MIGSAHAKGAGTTYEQWEEGVPEPIKGDSLWKIESYRLSLFLADLSWHDVTKLAQDRRTAGIADQLYRAVGKISSNIGEGYSRGTGKDRARFYEYALGSAREARDWYYKGRHILGDSPAAHRIGVCTTLTKLLLRMVSRERSTNRRVSSTK